MTDTTHQPTPPPIEIIEQLTAYRAQIDGLSTGDTLRWAARTFGKNAALATSLGAEDQVLTDLIARVAPQLGVFTLDTGRLFPESYDLIAETTKLYGLPIDIYFPEASAVETLVREHGVNLFRDSVELRKACCRIRKLEPLARALSTKAAWITGLRHEQSPTRTDFEVIEFDAVHGIYKINPLLAWSESDVWDYVSKHGVPTHALHTQNYPSIGCACCTRAVEPGEDVRAGRWWWETPDQKECGLHVVDGKLVRRSD
ncbi:MAG: phosphoadenylyl-sulfate reductase [Phycisphaerales bacterium]|jgi:phosphoadenosine phosphosulfate reductase|nr:phosphoadenylyl-sulfate reductase [Phycisphaerales bacterium]MBT7170514.1 phosphoadenylyl-sulfate reductase [Phycisphaerales bacterium]